MATETSCDPLQESDTADSSAVFFVACKDEVHPYRAGDHESWLSMGYTPFSWVTSTCGASQD